MQIQGFYERVAACMGSNLDSGEIIIFRMCICPRTWLVHEWATIADRLYISRFSLLPRGVSKTDELSMLAPSFHDKLLTAGWL